MYRTYAPTLVAALLLAAPLALAQEGLLDAPVPLEVSNSPESELRVRKLLKAWADATGRRWHASAQVRDLTIRIEPGKYTFDRDALLSILSDHSVVVLESETSLRAFHERELSSYALSTRGKIYEGDEALPQMNTPVTLAYLVRNGSGSTIFANLRGIMSRDQTRFGNILYVQGPERLIVTDLAPKVRYYRELIRLLDQPSAKSRRLTAYRVPGKTWTALKNLDAKTVRQRLDALRASGEVSCLEEATLTDGAHLARSIREGDQLTAIAISLGPPTGEKGKTVAYGNAPIVLDVELTILGEGRLSITRKLRLQAPKGEAEAVLAGALELDSKEGGSTHLVVTISP